MARSESEANLKAELCRARCKLSDVEEQLRFEKRSAEERYNGLYEKFEQKSVKLEANEHELKELSKKFRLNETELESVKKDLTRERSRVRSLRIQLMELADGQVRYFLESSTNTTSSLDTQTPDQIRPNNAAIFPEISDIYPPTDGSAEANRVFIGPPNFNTSTPTTPGSNQQATTRVETAVKANTQPKAFHYSNYVAKAPCVESIGETIKRMTCIKFKSPKAENTAKRQRIEKPLKDKDESLDTSEEEENLNLMSTTVVRERDQSSWVAPTTEVSDYVLIRLSPAKPKKGLKGQGKRDKYFVAKVTGGRIAGKIKLYRVEYLAKRTGHNGTYFVVNANTDQYEVEPEQIVKSLPSPDLTRRGIITFPGFSFDQYAMGL